MAERLRERNKRLTREEILRAAHELFVDRGYTETTVPDIANAAGVSTRTVFGYFPRKEDLLFSRVDGLIEIFDQALTARPEGEDTLTTVRKLMSKAPVGASELDAKLLICANSDPTLRNHLRARIAQLDRVLAPAIASDLGTTTDDPRTQLVTASLVAAINLIADRGAAKTKPWTPKEERANIDPVFTFLRAGLDALR
jgi:AcrR family transcriptional regulator